MSALGAGAEYVLGSRPPTIVGWPVATKEATYTSAQCSCCSRRVRGSSSDFADHAAAGCVDGHQRVRAWPVQRAAM